MSDTGSQAVAEHTLERGKQMTAKLQSDRAGGGQHRIWEKAAATAVELAAKSLRGPARRGDCGAGHANPGGHGPGLPREVKVSFNYQGSQ